jgi:hypothetical protein
VSAAIKRLETIAQYSSVCPLDPQPAPDAGRGTWLPYATQMLDTLQAGLQKIRPRMMKFAACCRLPCRPTSRNLLLTVFRAFASATRRCACGCSFPTIGPTCLKIRWTSRFAMAITTMPRLFPARGAGKPSGAGGLAQWIARHGEPQTLEELGQHNALIYVLRGRRSIAGPEPRRRGSAAAGSGTVMSDDAEVIRRLAVAEGIAYKSMLDVSDDIRAGRLRAAAALSGRCGAAEYDLPHRKQLSAAVRLLYEEVKSERL